MFIKCIVIIHCYLIYAVQSVIEQVTWACGYVVCKKNFQETANFILKCYFILLATRGLRLYIYSVHELHS